MRRGFLAIALLFLLCMTAAAKDKKKFVLPPDVFGAKTVLVMVDPEARIDPNDPSGNILAKENVEKALVRWGRFTPVDKGVPADLVIVVHKGHMRMGEPSAAGAPGNASALGTMGSPGPAVPSAGRTGNFPNDATTQSSQPQLDSGPTEDTFVVYRGAGSNPLSSPPVWRFSRTNALDPPGVVAVEAFQKLVAESEKQSASAP